MKRFNLIELLSALMLLLFSSCKKTEVGQPGPGEDFSATSKYSTDVLTKWIDLQTQIMYLKDQTQRPGYDRTLPFRLYSYAGIALYESVVPGMPGYQSLSGQLTDMPQMPKSEEGKSYHRGASANAALAAVHRSLLYGATAATKSSIDSLEAALNTQYGTEADAATLQRSKEFGKEVAKRIVEWSETDGSYTAWPPYTPPAGPGLWVPTPPNNFAARFVHVGDQRTFVPNILHSIFPPAPPAYSTDPSSGFYKMEKEVYDADQNRTPTDSLQATYWGANAGRGSPGLQWFAILKKVLVEQSVKLDKAVVAYCKMGMAQYDAVVVTFKSQYTYNLLRPITYIRNVMGQTNWLLPYGGVGAPTPDWPDVSLVEHIAPAKAISSMFGENYRFNTDGTNPDRYQGYTFNSFEEAAAHIATAFFLKGITTKLGASIGVDIGSKTVEYIDKKIKFKKN